MEEAIFSGPKKYLASEKNFRQEDHLSKNSRKRNETSDDVLEPNLFSFQNSHNSEGDNSGKEYVENVGPVQKADHTRNNKLFGLIQSPIPSSEDRHDVSTDTSRVYFGDESLNLNESFDGTTSRYLHISEDFSTCARELSLNSTSDLLNFSTGRELSFADSKSAYDEILNQSVMSEVTGVEAWIDAGAESLSTSNENEVRIGGKSVASWDSQADSTNSYDGTADVTGYASTPTALRSNYSVSEPGADTEEMPFLTDRNNPRAAADTSNTIPSSEEDATHCLSWQEEQEQEEQAARLVNESRSDSASDRGRESGSDGDDNVEVVHTERGTPLTPFSPYTPGALSADHDVSNSRLDESVLLTESDHSSDHSSDLSSPDDSQQSESEQATESGGDDDPEEHSGVSVGSSSQHEENSEGEGEWLTCDAHQNEARRATEDSQISGNSTGTYSSATPLDLVCSEESDGDSDEDTVVIGVYSSSTLMDTAVDGWGGWSPSNARGSNDSDHSPKSLIVGTATATTAAESLVTMRAERGNRLYIPPPASAVKRRDMFFDTTSLSPVQQSTQQSACPPSTTAAHLQSAYQTAAEYSCLGAASVPPPSVPRKTMVPHLEPSVLPMISSGGGALSEGVVSGNRMSGAVFGGLQGGFEGGLFGNSDFLPRKRDEADTACEQLSAEAAGDNEDVAAVSTAVSEAGGKRAVVVDRELLPMKHGYPYQHTLLYTAVSVVLLLMIYFIPGVSTLVKTVVTSAATATAATVSASSAGALDSSIGEQLAQQYKGQE